MSAQLRPRAALAVRGSSRFLALPVATFCAWWLLMSGRWGSYVGWYRREIFLTDILVGTAFVLMLARVASGTPSLAALRRLAWPDGKAVRVLVMSVAALLVFAVLRFIVGRDFSTTALRDLAPYGYAVVTGICLTERVPLSWRRWFWLPLVFHTAWVSLEPLLPSSRPDIGPQPLFGDRPDFDGAICGITAGLVLLVLAQGRMRRSWGIVLAAFALLNVYEGFRMGNRAGLLASLASVAVAAIPLIRRGARRGPTTTALAALGAIVALALGILMTHTGHRVIDTFNWGNTDASGTANARIIAWRDVARYIDRDPSRVAYGVGFGPDFLAASGGAQHLNMPGEAVVRSPHDYVLGTYARLGVPGGLVSLVMQLAGMVVGVGVVMSGEDDLLTQAAALLLVVLPIVAALGVILESPFGAVPYFWAVGWTVRRRTAGPEAESVADVTTRRMPHTVPG